MSSTIGAQRRPLQFFQLWFLFPFQLGTAQDRRCQNLALVSSVKNRIQSGFFGALAPSDHVCSEPNLVFAFEEEPRWRNK
jgi:hypothetical protein